MFTTTPGIVIGGTLTDESGTYDVRRLPTNVPLTVVVAAPDYRVAWVRHETERLELLGGPRRLNIRMWAPGVWGPPARPGTYGLDVNGKSFTAALGWPQPIVHVRVRGGPDFPWDVEGFAEATPSQVADLMAGKWDAMAAIVWDNWRQRIPTSSEIQREVPSIRVQQHLNQYFGFLARWGAELPMLQSERQSVAADQEPRATSEAALMEPVASDVVTADGHRDSLHVLYKLEGAMAGATGEAKRVAVVAYGRPCAQSWQCESAHGEVLLRIARQTPMGWKLIGALRYKDPNTPREGIGDPATHLDTAYFASADGTPLLYVDQYESAGNSQTSDPELFAIGAADTVVKLPLPEPSADQLYGIVPSGVLVFEAPELAVDTNGVVAKWAVRMSGDPMCCASGGTLVMHLRLMPDTSGGRKGLRLVRGRTQWVPPQTGSGR